MLTACGKVLFHLGQTVALVTGGVDMKVIGFSPNGNVWCEWKTADGILEEASFPPAALKQGNQRPEDPNLSLAQAIAEGHFSDRDVLEAVLEVLLSLASKITGKTVAVSLRNRHGDRAAIGESKNGVYYL